MKKKTLRCSTLLFSILVTGLLPASATHAQDLWIPYGSLDGALSFDSSTGLLHLPSVTVRANRSDPGRLLFDVVLTHVGGETFRVVSSRGLTPDQECTRAEVASAIPQLRLGMTVVEAETLIGCKVVTSTRETDLKLGRLVEASWVGQDGVPNSGSASYVSGSFITIGVSSNGIPVSGSTASPSGVPMLLSSSGRPAISLALREGVFESYSFANETSSRVCADNALVAGFASLQKGDSLTKIDDFLGCDGSLVSTTVSASATQEHYSWRSGSTPFFTSIPAERNSSNIEVTFVNGAMTTATKMTSTILFPPSPCSVGEIEAIAKAITVGMSEDALRALSICPTRSVTSVDTLASRTSNYSWGSQNASTSIYLSVNRSLSVSLQGGVVSAVSLRRQ